MRPMLWVLPFSAIGLCARPSIEKWNDGSDLESFVSRPDIRAPRLLVRKHKPERIDHGYWFMTPYSHVDDQPKTNRREFLPGQTGAHIYDGDGNLVWSGAIWGGNRNIFGGFQAFQFHGQDFLSMLVPPLRSMRYMDTSRYRSAVILNNQYEQVQRILLPNPAKLDFHEFNILPGGRSALFVTTETLTRSATELGQDSRKITESGFQEIDLMTGEMLFSWLPTENGVLLNETFDLKGIDSQPGKAWDWLHINAVDKNPDGDYFVSGRHANTIYKVSGKDGHVLWRLGGFNSDFEMDDELRFYWQHHVRFHSQNSTTTVISLFDNSADDANRNPFFEPSPATGKVIALDTASKPMRARLIRCIFRPEGDILTPKLGSLQLLGKDIEHDNLLVNWATEGYFSEHSGANDDCIVEARFQSPRMSSYRVHKSTFLGMPNDDPALRVLLATTDDNRTVASFYMSWNGATEVHSWNLYGGSDYSKLQYLGSARRTGFETAWVTPGMIRRAYAEAIDRNGILLRRSALFVLDEFSDGEYLAASSRRVFPPGPAVSAEDDRHAQEEGQTSENHFPYAFILGLALWGAYCSIQTFFSRLGLARLRRIRGYRPHYIL